MDRKAIARYAKLELARREFFSFCQLRAPDFYREDREYLRNLCDTMQDFYESEDQVLVINLPPRHGKSRTAGLFAQWIYGRNPNEKIMTGSYNETLSTTFSKAVRDGIAEEKADPDIIVYRDIFPTVQIKRGDGAMNLWSLEGAYSSYLATSPTGTATGFGASLLIIDDVIKNAEEAFNETVLEKQWSWFTDTMLSRWEENGKIIIIMTRWASGDIAGRAIEHFREQGVPCRTLIMKAVRDDGSMLCEQILSRKSYELKKAAMSEEIASANYQQIPIDLKGRLYQRFRTYPEKPHDGVRRCYIDTADTGADYLCGIVYEDIDHEAYVLDVIYTKEPMAVTEEQTAEMLFRNQVRECLVEGNNGGEGFARSVQRILRERFHWTGCSVRTFHQSRNKQARILSNASWVEQHVCYPETWRSRWPEYYGAMYRYQKEGKNKHDDAPDATTGVAEQFNRAGGWDLGHGRI